MASTHGFEVIAELTPGLLGEMLRAAWDSGGDISAPGTVPHSFDIAPGTAIGGYVIGDGQAQIPRDGLDVELAPSVNGIDLKLGLDIQVTLQDPPVPSAQMLSMSADVHVRAPVGQTGTDIDVGILLGGVPPSDVTATLTGGDSFATQVDGWIVDFVHAMYQSGKIPATMQQTDAPVGPGPAYLVDATADVYDDSSDPARTINVTRPDAAHLGISLPVHLRIYNIRRKNNLAPSLGDPMGITTRVNIVVPLNVDLAAGQISVDVTAPVVTTDPIVPAPAPYPAVERNNYNYNKSHLHDFIISIDLDAVLSQQLIDQTGTMVKALTNTSFSMPTTAQIEAMIASATHDQMVARGSVSVWTPDISGGISVTDLQTKALSDVLAIALNAGGGADANALTNFVPGGAGFAIALDGAKVLALIDQAIHRPESEGGFGPGFPPHRFHVDGHDVDLKRLDVSLTTAIHLSGDVTVINAILGSIDVDAGFDDDVGLHWVDNADGSQKLADDPGSPDVHLSAAAWIISFIIGFITFGVVGAVVAFVVMKIIEGIASNLGGQVVRDAANQVSGVGAWPSQLRGIGSVAAAFENPVEISPSGLVFKG